MPDFKCRLRIGFPSDDVDSPIQDDANNPVAWGSLTNTPRSNLLAAVQAKLTPDFQAGVDGEGKALFSMWDAPPNLLAAGNMPSLSEVTTYLDLRINEATANNTNYALAATTMFGEVDYMYYDDKIVCEHYYKLLKKVNGAFDDWTESDIQFDNGANKTWTIDLNFIYIAIRFSAA